MSDIKGTGADLTRCPAPLSFGYGTAVAMSTSATLTADVACCEIYMQAASSNVSAVYIGMNAAASLVLFELPRAVGSGVQSGWLVLPCPSTTCPTFYSNAETQSVFCIWR